MARLLTWGNLNRLDISARIRILVKFYHNPPETLYTKNAINELSFTLVTHTAYSDRRFRRYGFLNSGYGAELFWTAWTLERNPSFRGPKMSGSGRGLIMISAAYLPSSSTPTRTHDLGNQRNGYGRSRIALARSY
jgi:hypothetical protein